MSDDPEFLTPEQFCTVQGWAPTPFNLSAAAQLIAALGYNADPEALTDE